MDQQAFYLVLTFLGFIFFMFLAILVGIDSMTLHFEIKDRKKSTIALVVAGLIYGAIFGILFYVRYYKQKKPPIVNIGAWKNKNPRGSKFIELNDMQENNSFQEQ